MTGVTSVMSVTSVMAAARESGDKYGERLSDNLDPFVLIARFDFATRSA